MSGSEISTEITALHQHIQHTADALAAGPSGTDSDNEMGALIYLGNHHDAVPRDLIIDPVLLPDEIVTWMLMKIHVNNPMLATRIPSQGMLQERLKCSRPIVSRNIQVLRALRWITLCAEVRAAGGQFRGVVFAQHDTPLSLSETLYLDPGYIDWLEQPIKGDVLKRLQIVKRSVLAHIDHQVIHREVSLEQPTPPLAQVAARLRGQQSDNPLETHLATPAVTVKALETGSASMLDQIYGSKTPFDPQSANHVKNIDTVESTPDDHVKDIYTVKPQQNGHSHRVKKINMAPSSSSSFKSFKSFKNKNTTTPPTPPSSLRLPAEIKKSDRQATYAMKKLDRLPTERHQFALDYLADRIKAGKDGTAKPVGNPIQYLEWIVRSIIDGSLPESSYGLRENKPRASSTPAGVDPEASQRQFEAHMRSLGAEIDPETGLAVRAKG